jgi:hypothetical protein
MRTGLETLDRVRRLAAAANRSQQLADDDREARDAAIEEAEGEGLSVRQISDASGLSVGGVQGVIVKRTAARQARLRKGAGL